LILGCLSGSGGVRFSIVRNGGDSDRLPTSSTCFGKLLLPEYEGKGEGIEQVRTRNEKLARLLGLAVDNCVGFGNF